MPKTKAYIDRRRVLNELFRTRYYTLNELIIRVSERIGTSISKKTIQDMIKYMRAEGAPIINEPGRGYVYDPKAFNIEETEIESYSVEKLKLVVNILRQIPGLEMHEDIQDVFEKLEMRIGSSGDINLNYIQFDTRPEYTGAKYLAEILEAIKSETVINFDYKPFGHEKPINVTVHPYLLKEWNNRWFLIGLPEHLRENGEIDFHQYGLERINSRITPLKTPIYYRHLKFDESTFYKNVIGVTVPKGKTPEKVILAFSSVRSNYILTNPLHLSQKLVREGKIQTTFSYELILNPELETTILSFGADVVVIKPESLRIAISDKIKKAMDSYS